MQTLSTLSASAVSTVAIADDGAALRGLIALAAGSSAAADGAASAVDESQGAARRRSLACPRSARSGSTCFAGRSPR